MIKYSTQFAECYKNGETIPVQVTLKDNPHLAPAFPNKEFVAAMEDPDFVITTLDCGKFGGQCSSKNAGCVKMRGSQIS